MGVQFAFLNERLGAFVTFEGLLPAVDSDVPLQLPRRQERLVADQAVMRRLAFRQQRVDQAFNGLGVNECLLVALDVADQFVLFCKSFRTVNAVVWFGT